MKVFVTSDQHFTHFNIIKYANRPFELNEDGVKECINLIVNNYNSVVGPEDLVIHLGDLAHGRKQSKKNIGYILENLNGRKILIKGNHDEWDNEYYEQYFERVYDNYLHIGDTLLCHYPCYESRWTSPIEVDIISKIRAFDITRIIHGHVHNKNPNEWEPDGYERINASVDYEPNNYFPIEIDIPHINLIF